MSPIETLDSRDRIEVTVSAQERKFMLPTERRNPEIISWDWLSSISQLEANSCVVICGLLRNIQYRAFGDQGIQPTSIAGFVPGLSDAVAIFAYNHHRERQLLDISQDR